MHACFKRAGFDLPVEEVRLQPIDEFWINADGKERLAFRRTFGYGLSSVGDDKMGRYLAQRGFEVQPDPGVDFELSLSESERASYVRERDRCIEEVGENAEIVAAFEAADKANKEPFLRDEDRTFEPAQKWTTCMRRYPTKFLVSTRVSMMKQLADRLGQGNLTLDEEVAFAVAEYECAVESGLTPTG